MRILFISFYLFFISSTTVIAAEMVTGSVGQVGDKVITLREVRAATYIEKVLQKEVLKANTKVSSYGDLHFQKDLSQVLLDYVVYLEAENFSVAQVPESEIQKQMQDVAKALGSVTDWKKLEVQKSEMEQIISRKLRARQFLKFKTETSGVNISDEEAKTYFDKNRVRFGNVTFENFKPTIKDYLSQQALQEKLKEWFEVLKRKYQVRFLKAVD